MRYLLVDRILNLDPGKRATAIKNVTMSEDFLAHHFPDRPIMPGLLIIEALVQLADWVIRKGSEFRHIGLPIAFDRLKFRRVVRPGDQLRLEVEVVAQDGTMVEVTGKVYCLDALVTSADFTLVLKPIQSFISPAEAQRIFRTLYTEE